MRLFSVRDHGEDFATGCHRLDRDQPLSIDPMRGERVVQSAFYLLRGAKHRDNTQPLKSNYLDAVCHPSIMR